MKKIVLRLPFRRSLHLATLSLLGVLAACGGNSTQETPSITPQLLAQSNAVSANSDDDAWLSPHPPSAAQWLAKNVREIDSSDPNHENYHDLRSFGEAIGDARIVSLAQPDHGSGTVFDMKTRLVKYLHEKKGFDVLMMESSLFAVNRVWQQAQAGRKLIDIAPDNIFYMYSKSAEARKTLAYIDAQRNSSRPLILSSFSGTGSGANNERDDLFPMLESFLASRRSVALASSNWPIYKDVALKSFLVFPPQDPQPSPERIAAFDAIHQQLTTELCGKQADPLVFPRSPGIWCLVVKGMNSSANGPFGRPYDGEKVAAENFKWLYENVYKHKKIIIWSHYAHIGRGTQSPWAGGKVNQGSLLAEAYGKKIYVAAFTSSLGSELAWWNGAATTELYPVPADQAASLDAALASFAKPLLFVNARGRRLPAELQAMPAKVSNFTYWDAINTKLGDAYDGLFYLQTSQPARMVLK